MSSSRLPGKVMKEINGVKIIDSVVDRVSLAVGRENVFVLTSTEQSDDVLFSYLKRKGVNTFRGSLDNVLSRFSQFASSLSDRYDYIGRVCADSPFVDTEIMNIVHKNANFDIDFITTRYMSVNGIKSNVPKGKNYEIISCSSLVSVDAKKATNYEKEHVIPIFFNIRYNVMSVDAPYFTTLKEDCAIDTPEDLENWSTK